MSNKIKVQFMTDEAIETIRNNSVTVFNKLKENSLDSSWLKDIYSENPFKEKDYEIESFVLDFEQSGDYAKVDFANSIKLFENLKHLPRYILTDERFWAWINFTVGYKAARLPFLLVYCSSGQYHPRQL
jgi:predicted GNAT superfamily acetyltransferase